MFFKKFKKSFILSLLTLFIMPLSAFAYSDYVAIGGENIGIELNAKGVMVVGLYKVNDTYPAKEAGLEVGDTIIAVNDTKISNINDMVSKIDNTADKSEIKIQYLRGSKYLTTNLKLYKDKDNIYKTGLYVKDSITGLGTLTFVDPNTKLFGALGHEIIEKSTGKILEIKDGKIFDSTVTGIERGSEGTPGEKNADFDTSKITGEVSSNTTKGIFGNYLGTVNNNKLYKVAQPNEIKTGKASIFTVIEGTEVKEYSINITRITNYSNQENKNIMFEITDEQLLSKTGGIIQGMSGSPIIQDNKIIGAVTHVVVDNPAKGYGIFITNMLEEAEK